jgi:hypothetical protein
VVLELLTKVLLVVKEYKHRIIIMVEVEEVPELLVQLDRQAIPIQDKPAGSVELGN